MTETDSIRTVRESLGLKQKEFGALLDVHEMTVSKWERGQSSPSAYQKGLIQQFGKAAETEKFQSGEVKISDILVTAGVVFALAVLLKNIFGDD